MRLTCPLSVLVPLTLLGAAHAACDPGGFMPGGTRTYDMTSAGTTTTMTSKAVVKGDTATVVSTVNGTTTTTTWTCTARGMTASLGSGTSAMQVDNGTLPPTGSWRIGTSWPGHSELTLASGMTMTGTSLSRITAQEKVMTPAGRFTAFRVETTTKTSMKAPAGKTIPSGMAAAMNRTSKTVTWYARGVGMVKLTGADGGYSLILTKFSR